MNEINREEFTIVQLRNWLRVLKLPTNGNKSALVLRLNNVPADERGNCPMADTSVNPDDNRETSEGEEEYIPPNEVNNVVHELDLLRRELSIGEKERELLKKENELLKREQNLRYSTSSMQIVGDVNISEIKAFLPEYNGIGNVELWITQIENLKKKFSLSEKQVINLIMINIKGKAQVWLHSKPDYISIELQNLYKEMKTAFPATNNRIKIRREFENRKWLEEENFLQYFNDKMTLSIGLQLEEDELIEYIIDGITNYNLRTQATILGFKHTDDLLHAFKQIQLPKTNKMKTNSLPINRFISNKTVTCYNCSGLGHFSTACPLPKRMSGSCFRCGSTSHKVSQCSNPIPASKQVAFIGEDANTNNAETINELCETFPVINKVSVAFSCDGGDAFNTFVSLFDTGSPISLVRYSTVPEHLIKNKHLVYSGHSGLGNFKLYTYGHILINIKFLNIVKVIKVFIVSDNCIPYPLILGRDFLNCFCIKLTNIKMNKVLNKNIQNFDTIIDTKRHKILNSGLSASQETSSQLNTVIPSSQPVKHAENSFTQNINKKIVDDSSFDIYSKEINNVTSEIDINPGLNKHETEIVHDIIQQNYINTSNIPAIEHEYKMHIQLTSHIPISFSPRRLSYSDKQIVEKNIEELLKSGFIRYSTSPYAFPLVLTDKKDGTKRQCVDYSALNKVTVRDSYPLPVIDDCLEKLEGKSIFTTLDLKSGFHHIKVSEESIKYTAFITPYGHYEYTVMPFGLKNGSMVFQRFINFVMAEFIKEGSVSVYIDDITLATKTIAEHFDLLKRVLRRCAEFRLQINFSKCKFCYDKISLLGFDIDNKGIRPNKKHIQAIQNLPYPSNKEEVNKCLGLFSYFRRFIPSFSAMSQPLRNLTKSNQIFEFSDSCKQCFDLLREKLISSPILALYNPKRETELHCDASALGFGAVLFQKQDDQKFHPIGYFSKTTTPAESRYHSFELEALAVVYALRKFRIYLEGIPIRIITDCNSLAMTLNRRSINARIARWALELENYDYTIKHRKGNLMGHVDTLSRIHITNVSEDNKLQSIVCALQADDIDIQLNITQGRDSNITQIRDRLEKEYVSDYVLEDGLVFRVRNKRKLFYVPKEMEDNIIRQSHEQICHMGVSKCIEQIKKYYWFPNMQEKVGQFIKNCIKCILYSDAPHFHNRTLHNIQKKPIPFDTIHLDHFGPLPSIASKRKHVLLVVDAFTKFIKLFAVNSTSTKEVCACLDKYVEFYSRPRRIITDRGTCFTSNEFSSYLIDQNIEHVKIATASPQANGQVERVNRVLKSMLAKISEPIQHSDWYRMLIRIEYAVNNSIHSATKFTPSQLLFGIDQRGREVDALSEFIENKQSLNTINLQNIRTEASNNIISQQKKSTENHANKIKPHVTFSVGDYVVIRNIDTSIGTNKKTYS